jgi:hypothetical protein
VITDIRELLRAFDDAALHADTDRLNALLADDFMSIGERGFQLDKQQWIVLLIRCRDQAKAGPADAYLDGGATIGDRPGDGQDVIWRVDQQILSR